MKVIDWLLRVSNGEIHEDTEFKINGEKIEGIKDLGEYKILSKELLNSTVEIIEEDKKKEENKEIEGLWITSSGLHSGEMSNGYEEENLKDIVKHNFNVIHNKINKIINVINEMREDK